MRYGTIAPIIVQDLMNVIQSKTAFYTEISAKGLMGPDAPIIMLRHH